MHGAVARHLHNLPSESPVRPGTHCASSALTPLVQARKAGAPTAFPVPPPPLAHSRGAGLGNGLFPQFSAPGSPHPLSLPPPPLLAPAAAGASCTGTSVRGAALERPHPACDRRRPSFLSCRSASSGGRFLFRSVPSAASAAARVRAPRGQRRASRRRHLQGVAVFARGCHGHSDASTGTEALSSAWAPTSRGASRFQGVILHRMIISTLSCISQVLNVCYTEHSTC